MKKLVSFLGLLLLATLVQAQISKTIDVQTAGTLSSLLTTSEKASITNLTVTGNLDARDIKCIRDELTSLINLDISVVTIEAYTGNDGTVLSKSNAQYIANEMPKSSFVKINGISTNLTTVILPNSVTSIGIGAFTRCLNLKKIALPTQLLKINDSAFSQCISLDSIIIPSNVKSIGDLAFSSCSGLTSFTFSSPYSVTDIGSYTFQDCIKLNTITIPSSVVKIGDFAFVNSSCMISVDSNNVNYSSSEGVFFNKSQTNLISCPITKAGIYKIPNSVNTIEISAFQNCINLVHITFPTSLTKINNVAFQNCIAIDSLSISSNVTFIGVNAFQYCSGIINVENNNPNYSSAEGVLFNKTKVTLIQCPTSKKDNYNVPTSVVNINNGAFSGCSNLTSIIIPSSVNNIAEFSFSECNGLITISLPSSISKIGDYAFCLCKNLKSIVLPSKITKIGWATFYSCNSLTSIIIPELVDSLDCFAFSGCSSLTSIILPKSVESVGTAVFDDCSNLNSIYLKNPLPPLCDMTFSIPFKQTCILYVPVGCKAIYQQANEWKDFSNIVEVTTALSNIHNSSIKIIPNGSEIRIDGTLDGEIINIYTLNGVKVRSVKSNDNSTNISLERNKLYFIETSTKTLKVVL